ncbi:hypothetical protein Tsubulata_035845 [Turnera subulata]|uniref:DUF7780 domain-containing protein n=1 Tax=Turnera subulata TaxID=218843 RepID=A0A9Q0FVB9_9ROSI|nr:hypothetical protein Tsubulata_035845 [Turnera subulata]
MGSPAKSTTKSSNEKLGGGGNMGLLLVFFPEDTNANTTPSSPPPAASTAAISLTSSPLSSSASSTNSSSSPFSSSPGSRSGSSTASSRVLTIKRTNSNNPILTKTQSTFSICALLLFFSLLLFTLSTFEPTTTITKTPRRLLSSSSPPPPTTTKLSWMTRALWSSNGDARLSTTEHSSVPSFALQGMGKLYRRGTRAMSDLVVGHVVEDTSEAEFRRFLTSLHSSGLPARADIVFVFGSSSSASRFEALIEEENDSFLKLVYHYKEMNFTASSSDEEAFDATRFVTRAKKEDAEPLWGKKIRIAANNARNESGEVATVDGGGELTRLSYGSVVGFDASELDPENSLSGFLDSVPMSLRRWACYPMLLGRVKRNFKHIMLVDVKNVVLHGDLLGRVRNRSPESVSIMAAKQETKGKHSKTNSGKTQSHIQVNSGVLIGGARGIRRLSNAMLTEIVRATMQHKRKGSVTELGILSQLVGNQHILKNIDLVVSSESMVGPNSLAGSNPS